MISFAFASLILGFGRAVSLARMASVISAVSCISPKLRFIEAISHPYATVIGENGSELSGGERQRISIARALLKDAPIVLLDEATASLDVENETKVQGALSRLLQGKTVLVIAHRMRTVEAADQIVVLADGKVAEAGTPAELLEKKDGMFRRMTRLQTISAEWSI